MKERMKEEVCRWKQKKKGRRGLRLSHTKAYTVYITVEYIKERREPADTETMELFYVF
jgi:hypothetical protein